MQRQISELLNKKDGFLKHEAKSRRRLVDQMATIGRMREEILGLRRTVAGSGLHLARLKKEVDDGKRLNTELKHRNHSLHKELRRAGQRLLDLGN